MVGLTLLMNQQDRSNAYSINVLYKCEYREQ